jgi:GDP/UDP-N,N'-diacetylbacillosamine 2-epimerase (hydrolysing)
MSTVLKAVHDAGLAATCIYPNSDRGSSGVIAAIETHAARNGKLRFPCRVSKSLDRDAYLQALIDADVLVGNSSSGIIEAATAGTPAVNIGHRQDGRERSGKSVISVGEDYASVRKAVDRALRMGPITARQGVYGDGNAGPRIASHLAAVPFDEKFRRKLNSY